jgi:hypothetical protein
MNVTYMDVGNTQNNDVWSLVHARQVVGVATCMIWTISLLQACKCREILIAGVTIPIHNEAKFIFNLKVATVLTPAT